MKDSCAIHNVEQQLEKFISVLSGLSTGEHKGARKVHEFENTERSTESRALETLPKLQLYDGDEL